MTLSHGADNSPLPLQFERQLIYETHRDPSIARYSFVVTGIVGNDDFARFWTVSYNN